MSIQTSRYAGDVAHEYTVDLAGTKKTGYSVRRKFSIVRERDARFKSSVENMLGYQISFFLFGVYDYWWVIHLANVIFFDPFTLAGGTELKIPSLSESKKEYW